MICAWTLYRSIKSRRQPLSATAAGPGPYQALSLVNLTRSNPFGASKLCRQVQIDKVYALLIPWGLSSSQLQLSRLACSSQLKIEKYWSWLVNSSGLAYIILGLTTAESTAYKVWSGSIGLSRKHVLIRAQLVSAPSHGPDQGKLNLPTQLT